MQALPSGKPSSITFSKEIEQRVIPIPFHVSIPEGTATANATRVHQLLLHGRCQAALMAPQAEVIGTGLSITKTLKLASASLCAATDLCLRQSLKLSETEMKDITLLLAKCRESARHLWNTYFVDRVNAAEAFDHKWNIVDQFRQIERLLLWGVVFDELDEHRCEIDPGKELVSLLHVVPEPATGVPIMISRPSADGNKYWDDPVDRVQASEVDLRFIEYFDWDQLGPREFQYYRVRIQSFSTHPHLVGRDALLETRFARVLLAGQEIRNPA